jgi:molecular chaperone GrpE
MAQKQKKSVSSKNKATTIKKSSKLDQSKLVGELKQTLEQEKDKYLRLFAEFENFKKRTSKERIELFKTAGQEVISSLLPLLDDFDRASSQASKDETEKDIEGFILIKNKFGDIMKSNGLGETETQIGDDFDAEIHEAITQIPADDDTQKGKIIDIIEKGYSLGEKIIRYPKVVVGQ